MNITLARTFLELLNARNFNRAADRLCVTQSTVTVRIAALEQQLGQQLFIRDKSGVEATVAGRKFQPYAELLLQTWQHARQEINLSSGQTVMFSIGASLDLWDGFAGPWLLETQHARPDIALNVESGSASFILEKLAQGFLDAALLYEPYPRNGIVIRGLYDEHLVLVSTYPRKAERWNPQYVFIRWGEDFVATHRALMPTDITPPAVFADGKMALEFVLARGGSAYFPLRQVQHLIEQKKLFVVENASLLTRRVYIANTESVATRDWFQEAMAKLQTYVEQQEKLNAIFHAEASKTVMTV